MIMQRKIRHFILFSSLFIAASLVNSCSLSSLKQISPPSVQFDHLNLTSIARSGISFNLFLKLTNLNNFILPASKLSYDFYLNDALVASVTNVGVPSLAQNQPEVLGVPTTISATAVKSIFDNILSTTEYKYKVVGYLSIYSFRKGFSFTGDFPLPKLY